MRLFLNSFFSILLAFSMSSMLTMSTAFADEATNTVTNKEVYNFKSQNGTPVFTDMKPKNQLFDTQMIKTTEPSEERLPITNNFAPNPVNSSVSNNTDITQNTTTIINHYNSRSIKTSKDNRKTSKRRCKYYKRKLEKVMSKMRAGYAPSKYQRLEKERVKYRKLVFDKCATREN